MSYHFYFKYYKGWKPSTKWVLPHLQILTSISVKKRGGAVVIVLQSWYGKPNIHPAFFGKGSRSLLYQMFWKESNCGIGWKFQTGAFPKHFYWFLLSTHGVENLCLHFSYSESDTLLSMVISLFLWGFGGVFAAFGCVCVCVRRTSPDPKHLWSVTFRAVNSGLSPGCQDRPRWLFLKKGQGAAHPQGWFRSLWTSSVYLGFVPGQPGSARKNLGDATISLFLHQERLLNSF